MVNTSNFILYGQYNVSNHPFIYFINELPARGEVGGRDSAG